MLFFSDTEPNPVTLLAFFESITSFVATATCANTGKSFQESETVADGRIWFSIANLFEINQEMYNPLKYSNISDVKIRGGYVGKTSLNSIITTLTKSGESLMKTVSQVVSIDPSLKLPLVLPKAWRDKYINPGSPDHTPLRFKILTKPDNSQSFRVNVVHSDIDSNKHTNFGCYVRYGLDALYHNVNHGFINTLPNLGKMGMKRMELFYMGQSFEGDVLDVFVWPDSDDDLKVHVHIEKTGQLIFQSTFEYHDRLFRNTPLLSSNL